MDNRIFKVTAAAAVMAAAVSCGGGHSARESRGEEGGDTLLMITGSYAPASEEGVALYVFDTRTGASRRIAGLAGISNPSYLAVGSGGKMIYSVGEDAGSSSTVNAIALDRGARSLALVASDTTGGGAPCHVAVVSRGGRDTHVVTANYLGGSATIYRLGADGRPEGSPEVIRFEGRGADPERQGAPHAHFVTFTPDSSRMLVTDLGTDRIHIFPMTGDARLVDAGAMTDLVLPPGAGPRHIDFSRSLPVAYLLDEIDGNVNVIDIDSMAVVQTVKADSVGAQGAADIHLSPDGRYLYASNRLKADGIAIFAVDSVTGRLTPAGYCDTGAHPRNFAITPDGRFMLVACRDTDTIEVYAIDPATGALARAGHDIAAARPVCVKFIP